MRVIKCWPVICTPDLISSKFSICTKILLAVFAQPRISWSNCILLLHPLGKYCLTTSMYIVHTCVVVKKQYLIMKMTLFMICSWSLTLTQFLGLKFDWWHLCWWDGWRWEGCACDQDKPGARKCKVYFSTVFLNCISQMYFSTAFPTAFPTVFFKCFSLL